MFDQEIANTRETIVICDEGLKRDAKRDYYEPPKRKFVQHVKRDAQKRLKWLLALKANAQASAAPSDSRR